MSTEREYQNARRDYEQQIKEASPSWWQSLLDAARELKQAIVDEFNARPDSPAKRRASIERKAEIERAAKDRL